MAGSESTTGTTRRCRSGSSSWQPCATSPPSSSEAIRLNSSRLQSDRHLLAGAIATVPGYLVSARMIGDNVCFKVLVDETLRFAPELLIENFGQAKDPTTDLMNTYQRVDPRLRTPGALDASRRDVDIRLESGAATSDLAYRAAESGKVSPSLRLHQTGKATLARQSDLQRELTIADTHVVGLAHAATPSRATVIQACKRPPTEANEKAVRHALEWLDPLKKPACIENAPILNLCAQSSNSFISNVRAATDGRVFRGTRSCSREYSWARARLSKKRSLVESTSSLSSSGSTTLSVGAGWSSTSPSTMASPRD